MQEMGCLHPPTATTCVRIVSSDHPLASLYYSRPPTKTFGTGNKRQVSH